MLKAKKYTNIQNRSYYRLGFLISSDDAYVVLCSLKKNHLIILDYLLVCVPKLKCKIKIIWNCPKNNETSTFLNVNTDKNNIKYMIIIYLKYM